jgi:hypothetical protein
LEIFFENFLDIFFGDFLKIFWTFFGNFLIGLFAIGSPVGCSCGPWYCRRRALCQVLCQAQPSFAGKGHIQFQISRFQIGIWIFNFWILQKQRAEPRRKRDDLTESLPLAPSGVGTEADEGPFPDPGSSDF